MLKPSKCGTKYTLSSHKLVVMSADFHTEAFKQFATLYLNFFFTCQRTMIKLNKLLFWGKVK